MNSQMGEDDMLITTGYNFEGYVITQYIDVISASVVLGTGIFSSFGLLLQIFPDQGVECMRTN